MTPALRRLLLPALVTAVAVLILLGLGTWQVERLQWKRAILAQIDAGERAPPVPLGPHPEPFTKVTVSGRFRFDKAALYGAEVRQERGGAIMGAQQIVPLERTGAPPILVERGWVPGTPSSQVDQPTGEVAVTGYVRPGEPAHWFTPATDLAARRFYALDPEAMGVALGLPKPAPFVLVALGSVPPGQYPVPAGSLPRPQNNHLSYAITWYGLAVAAIAVFIVWARKRPEP
ncbi:MAG: SURF1 family protein [Proteobacteria bacterium]|nr:SURF1 family protein [Pseudomonadota bacterium]